MAKLKNNRSGVSHPRPEKVDGVKTPPAKKAPPTKKAPPQPAAQE